MENYTLHIKLCINAFSLKEVSKKFLKFKRMLVIHSIE